jgi:hypothetical protein
MYYAILGTHETCFYEKLADQAILIYVMEHDMDYKLHKLSP